MTTLLMACISMAIAALTVGHLIMWDLSAGIIASCVMSALVMHWLDILRG